MAQHARVKCDVEKCGESYGLFPLLNCETSKVEIRRDPVEVPVIREVGASLLWRGLKQISLATIVTDICLLR